MENNSFMENFEQVLSETYPGQPQRKRIGKEVENLINQFEKESIEMQYLKTPLGIKINITLTFDYIDKQIGSSVLSDILKSKQVNFVIFDILLDQKFPFSPPMVYMVSQLGVELEFNDGRGE